MAGPAELKHMLKDDRTGLTAFWADSVVRAPGNPAYGLVGLPEKYHKGPDKFTWHELPQLARLGIKDILYTIPSHSLNPAFGVGGPNITLKLFTMEYDPASASFGESEKSVQGGVMFK
ncbi:hypothetical protein Slin15195_G042440 [Septoria linicola]|uniref:Uncharacterized protein n=1 Tax=Septoria linicola TaxID=215465 RepID=A0A9Q9EHF1_9PEZI|nr:hypothetical protein Slin14017_G045960 [Septoria linicola]USW50925.1 hypothetical protein Slin15195_G042440 [Septoria linicola]